MKWMVWMKPVGVGVWTNCWYCFNYSGEEERVWLQPTFFHFRLHGFEEWKIKCKKLVIAKLEAATKSCLENETFLKLLFKILVHFLPKVSSVIVFKEFEHSLLSLSEWLGTTKVEITVRNLGRFIFWDDGREVKQVCEVRSCSELKTYLGGLMSL